MKRIRPILLLVIALSVYSCQKDQSVKTNAANGTLSTKDKTLSLKNPRDTTPPPAAAMRRDTTPPPLK
jgi:hypothetical protein